jgi:hypothetical protein
LKAHSHARCHWIDCQHISVSLWRAVLGIPTALDLAEGVRHPHLIIAAGRITHRLLAANRHRRDVKTFVLMRPSFPRRWFDGALIPEHDGSAADKRTLVTTGALNAVTPIARLTQRPNALVLIGGPSRHFNLDDQAIMEQINILQTNWPDWHWTLAASRRTPPALITRLEQMTSPHCQFCHHDQTHSEWLGQTLANSRAVWVTPDSASMVYEALTSGVPTGLLNLPARSRSRVARGIQSLHERELVGRFNEQSTVMTREGLDPERFWEADRAAQWILKRWRGETG